MKVLILGADGYLGWPTAMYFSKKGHDVLAIDNMVKREWEKEVNIEPLIKVKDFISRANYWNEINLNNIKTINLDIANEANRLNNILEKYQPDTIIHYAEQPSAPYSMMNQKSAVYTQVNNIIGNLNVMLGIRDYCPNAHLIKLGTMGEYGTPNIDIEEGWIEIHHKGRSDRMLYPKRAHSLYHLSKVADSNNLEFGCRIWNLAVTDLNQGVVYGIRTNEILEDTYLNTSFHYDDIFGTVINRFIVQAVVNEPLTVYGNGNQIRGYLNILDTLQCVEIAALNPAKPGEFRVFNQFTEQMSILEIAEKIKLAAKQLKIKVKIKSIDNPRKELETHYYNAENTSLMKLGLKPNYFNEETIIHMLEVVLKYKDLINKDYIMPKVTWEKGLK